MLRRFSPDAHTDRTGQGTVSQFLQNGFDRLFRSDGLVKAELTPYQILYQRDLLSVRYYPPLRDDTIQAGDQEIPVAKERHRTPVVLVPPLAASTLIFDLLPERSLVRFLLAHGYEVYFVDFGRPDREHAHFGVREYTMDMLPTALAQVREHSGEEDITLFGYCMGGLFALIYAGVHDDPHIRNIVTIGSPINMHDNMLAARALMLLNGPTQMIRRYTGFRVHNLDPRIMQMPGWMNSLTFKMTAPLGTVTTYWDLLANLADREFVEVHTTTSQWFDHMLDYPGGIVQDFFVKVGLDNALATGRMDLGDAEAEFHRVNSALLAIAGETDTLVGERSARAVMDVVNSEDKTFAMAPGGHAGVFAGGKAPGNSWRMAVDWLAERSD